MLGGEGRGAKGGRMTAAEYLARVEARAERATKGPWKHEADAEMFLGVAEQVHGPDLTINGRTSLGQNLQPRSDAAFIAASRTDIPRFVRMLRVAIVTLASRADYDEQGKPSNADAVALEKIDAIANE